MRPVSVRNRRQGSNIAIMHVRRQTKTKIKWGLVLNGVVITKISKKNNMLLNHWANIPLSFCTHRSRQSGPWKVELTSLWWRPCHACLRRNWLWKRFSNTAKVRCHSYVMTWKHLLYYWPFVRGIHRPPVDSPHEGPVIRSFIFFLCCYPEQDAKQAVELPAIWEVLTLVWRHFNSGALVVLDWNNHFCLDHSRYTDETICYLL